MGKDTCQIKNCQKRDHRDCHKKPCEKPCKDRFDSWECHSDECGQVKGKKVCYRVCSYVYDQRKCEHLKWGHTEKIEECPESVCDAAPRLHGKKQCDKKQNNVRRH